MSAKVFNLAIAENKKIPLPAHSLQECAELIFSLTQEKRLPEPKYIITPDGMWLNWNPYIFNEWIAKGRILDERVIELTRLDPEELCNVQY